MSTNIFQNIKSLVGILDPQIEVLKGKEMLALQSIPNAYLIEKEGMIVDFGEMKNFPKEFEGEGNFIDLQNKKMILPCYCDSHTHLVFAASRENEFVERIQGLSYAEIAANGGGILNSAKRLEKCSEEDLYSMAWERLQKVIRTGTGAIEIKSGYGLSLASELKMLRVIKKLKEHSPIPIKANFLAAHAFPLEYKENHQGYIDLIIHEMLPVIQKEGLADYIDAFCEYGFFSVEETDQILKAGKQFGLKAKIHANQLNHSGGVQIGVKNDAISVDHLECVGEEEIQCLKHSKTIGTLLPSAAFFLGIGYQPARKMIDAGLGIALASDFNPGSSPSGNMNFVFSLACTQLKMMPSEAFNACTINGAYAMELQKELGSISIGKRANLIITKEISSFEYIPYSFAENQIDFVFINSKKYES